jgi:hypothetical protein
MGEKDYIGKRGELIFGVLIMQKCAGRYWFDPEYLGGKVETKDFTVTLIKPDCGQGTFFVQVKATSKGYKGTGKKRRLKVNVTKAEVLKLKQVPGPAFVAGVDVETETGFMHPIT